MFKSKIFSSKYWPILYTFQILAFGLQQSVNFLQTILNFIVFVIKAKNVRIHSINLLSVHNDHQNNYVLKSYK